MHRTPEQQKVVKSVSRMFEVLECLARLKAPLSAIEIGRRFDYPASSTAAILKSMAILGYLAFDRKTRTYFPTLRLTFITGWIDSAILGDAQLHKLIAELWTNTGETIIIAGENDLHSQYLLSRPGLFPIGFHATAGILRPLCKSGTGWALLSAKPEAEVTALVWRVNQGASNGQKIEVPALLDQLAGSAARATRLRTAP